MWFWITGAMAADWAAALATGDCTTVVAALPEPAVDVERLAVARCLLHAGEAGRADEVLQPVQGDLLPWARLVRGQALVQRGRPAEAIELLAGASLSGVEDDLWRAKALVAAGRSEEAKAPLNTLLTSSVADEARYWLGVGAWERGEKDAARAVWGELWAVNPTSIWADRAAERLRQAETPVPDYTTADGRALAMRRVKTLLAQKQANLAVELIDGVHAQDPFDTAAEQRFVADAFFDAKTYARAAEWYTKLGGEKAGSTLLFKLALSTARGGSFDDAAPLYERLVALYPTSAEADEASWKTPYMDHDAGRLEEAVAGFEAYLRARPTGKFAGDARWLRAWDLYKLGRIDEAKAGFDRVLSTNSGETVAAAAYWKARANDDLVALRDIIRKYPDTSYAWFAADRLGVTYPKAEEPTRPEFPAEWIAARPKLATAHTLARAGMADWAKPLVGGYVAEAKGSSSTALPMAWLLLDVEDFLTAKSLGCAYASNPAGRAACTPRPHLGAVRAISAEYGLDPLLPYAIMNAESGLDPFVTSPAGARGLMQLMPALARTLAEGRVANFEVDDLYRAGVNARLGTTELGLLNARFRNSAVSPGLPLVIAGYNGGGDAVERWLKTYPAAPEADRFAEDISFTETRRYVRRVLGYLMGYRRVYGDG